MSGSLNKVQLIGNLGADPESRTMQNGRPGGDVERRHERKLAGSGVRRTPPRTEWHRVVIFNEGLGKVVEQYLAKGAKVYVGGMPTRKWRTPRAMNVTAPRST
jgi:single-strand DNA-binding protein